MRQAVASLLLLPVIAVALPIARKLQDDDPPTCPPPNFDSVAGFNLARYISAPWFSIQQVPLIYQPSDELFCVRATYVPINPSDLSEGIHVFNEARAGSTSGERIGVSPSSSMPSQLLAFPDDLPEAQANASTAQSKLRVGVRELGFLYRTPVEPSEVSLPVIPGLPEIADIIPSFLQPLIPPEVNNFLANILEVVPTIISLIPSLIIGAVSRGGGQQPMMTPGNATSSLDTLFGVLVGLIPDEVIDFLQRAFFGPYWVVAISDDYQWAIISGGPPNVESGGLCTTGTLGINNVGFWLFHRNPTPPAEVVQQMRNRATELGYDVSVLQPVEQAGCEYTQSTPA